MRPQSLLLSLLMVVRELRAGTPRPAANRATAPIGNAAENDAQLARLAACWAARHGTSASASVRGRG